jgi:serine/threonine protein kinase
VQVCLGLQHVHEKGILHRDINVTNIFLKNDYEIRIGDFGISKILFNPKNRSKGNESDKFVCDINALGLFLYELCIQNQSFKSNKSGQIKKTLKKGKVFY